MNPVHELQCEQPRWNRPRSTCVQNSLSTNRPSFAAANQVVTLTNERAVTVILLACLLMNIQWQEASNIRQLLIDIHNSRFTVLTETRLDRFAVGISSNVIETS